MTDYQNRNPNSSSKRSESEDDSETYRLAQPNPVDVQTPIVPPPSFGETVRTDRKSLKSSRSAPATKRKPIRPLGLVALNFLVFITSICIMMLELTASRLIAKSVGSSLYTWTSVIGVVLAGITLGNWIGGWMADRFDRRKGLSWMYLFGSLSCASVLWLDQQVVSLSRPPWLSWPTWILIVVASIFLLPSIFLGTISPLAASLALSQSTKTGTTVGNVYAWGAFGSIVGTFLTGFYLIDVIGSVAIIGLTAGILALLALAIATSRYVFRIGIACLWMPFLLWLVVVGIVTGPMMASVGQLIDDTFSTTSDGQDFNDDEVRVGWSSLAERMGKQLHHFGVQNRLRPDHPYRYYDESHYSSIEVGESTSPYHINEETGEWTRIRYLQLDKLIHSYFDPTDPFKLHYEYERIYAAITQTLAGSIRKPVTISLVNAPEELLTQNSLPSDVVRDTQANLLRMDNPSDVRFSELRSVSRSANLWNAIEELVRDTNHPQWSGFSSTALSHIPSGFEIPTEFQESLQYDSNLGVLTSFQRVTPEMQKRIVESAPDYAWFHDVEMARRQATQPTSLFIGGGGFIFPRWFLNEYPKSPRIEVAELDAAVYHATLAAFGMTVEEEKRISTWIGDARNFIDDRLTNNQWLRDKGREEVKYDFIYGDAFNDFGIPAHLTTVEFLKKVDELLNDNGIFMVNVIDIYPRTEIPGRRQEFGEVAYSGYLPSRLARKKWSAGIYREAGRLFAPLEILQQDDHKFRIRTRRKISIREEAWLANVNQFEPALKLEKRSRTSDTSVESTANEKMNVDANGSEKAWKKAISELAMQSRKRVSFSGEIPEALRQGIETFNVWVPRVAPFESVEVMKLESDQFVLGLRGSISESMAGKLAGLDSENSTWTTELKDAVERSRKQQTGRFLGRYVATAAKVFPNIYVYQVSMNNRDAGRDTFVIACSKKPIDRNLQLKQTQWPYPPFAYIEKASDASKSLDNDVPNHNSSKAETKQSESGHSNETQHDLGNSNSAQQVVGGQMESLLELADGKILTDDFAPVDNLMLPVFGDYE